jgi:cob(I)alamin adenosyltransferase
VDIADEMEIPPLVIVYLNRLSDVLFTLARLANKRASAEETAW